MTPKDKALELVSKMCLNNCTDKNIKLAKQCAITAVTEILDVCLPCYLSQKEFNEFINYWIEVKQEIEKI